MMTNIANSSWQFTNDIQSNFIDIETLISSLETRFDQFVGDSTTDSTSLIQRIQILEEENNELKQRLDQLEFLLQEN